LQWPDHCNFGSLQAGRPLNLLSAPPTSPWNRRSESSHHLFHWRMIYHHAKSTIRLTDWYLWCKLPSILSLEACIQSLAYFQYGSQRVSAEAAQCFSKSIVGACDCIRSLTDGKAIKEQNSQQRRLALVMKLPGSNPSPIELQDIINQVDAENNGTVRRETRKSKDRIHYVDFPSGSLLIH
jgi:hypothetical protein